MRTVLLDLDGTLVDTVGASGRPVPAKVLARITNQHLSTTYHLLRTLVHERSLVSRAVGGTRIEISPLGRDATLVGAAEVAFEPVLSAV